jgi:hypothetical protein
MDDGDSRIEAGDSRIVQFSHFSVKEFLTSSCLADATSGEVLNYIDLEPYSGAIEKCRVCSNAPGHCPDPNMGKKL